MHIPSLPSELSSSNRLLCRIRETVFRAMPWDWVPCYDKINLTKKCVTWYEVYHTITRNFVPCRDSSLSTLLHNMERVNVLLPQRPIFATNGYKLFQAPTHRITKFVSSRTIVSFHIVKFSRNFIYTIMIFRTLQLTVKFIQSATLQYLDVNAAS